MNRLTVRAFSSLIRLSTVLAFFWSVPRVAAQQPIGYVADVSGGWFLGSNPQQRLAKGYTLPAGGVIKVQSPAQDDYIVIVNLKGDIIASRACRNSGVCARPLKLPQAAAPEPSILDVIVSSAMGLLWGEPDRYSIHRKRDGSLSDAVVQIKDDRIDLSPVFERKGKGRYYLRLRAIPREGKPAGGKWVGPLTLDWDPTKPSAVPAPGLQPGLYELALLDREGDDYLPAGASAWVLISRPAEFSNNSSSYQAARALTQKWGAAVTPEAKGSFLRAQLDRLAASTTK